MRLSFVLRWASFIFVRYKSLKSPNRVDLVHATNNSLSKSSVLTGLVYDSMYDPHIGETHSPLPQHCICCLLPTHSTLIPSQARLRNMIENRYHLLSLSLVLFVLIWGFQPLFDRNSIGIRTISDHHKNIEAQLTVHQRSVASEDNPTTTSSGRRTLWYSSRAASARSARSQGRAYSARSVRSQGNVFSAWSGRSQGRATSARSARSTRSQGEESRSRSARSQGRARSDPSQGRARAGRSNDIFGSGRSGRSTPWYANRGSFPKPLGNRKT